MRAGRKLDWHPPNLDLREFDSSWHRWLDKLKTSKEDMSGLVHGGGNGNWLLVLCLVWWWDALQCIEDHSSQEYTIQWQALDAAKNELKETFKNLLALPNLADKHS